MIDEALLFCNEIKKQIKPVMKNKSNNKKLSPQQSEQFIQFLQTRFEKNKKLHKGLDWKDVKSKLEKNPEKLW